MSLQILTKRERKMVVSYSRSFAWRDMPNAGFGFDSDEAGNVDVSGLHSAGLENYEGCISGRLDVIDRGVERREHSYMIPATGRCACKRIVTLDGDYRGEGIDCECGRIYNFCGQELAPRSQWED